jgi:hypothetical protein
MSENYLPVEGDIVPADSLSVRKAADLARFLASDTHPYASFIEARRRQDGLESVVFEVDVEVGQEPVHDIRRVERLAVLFRPDDETFPEVLALRPDFPADVPHRSLRDEDLPVGLCLYEEPYAEVKLRWTAPLFLERVRYWLAKTAEGTLHQEDQPLEPLLLGPASPLIIPSDLALRASENRPQFLNVMMQPAAPRGHTYIAVWDESPADPNRETANCVAVVIRCDPQQHGIIRRRPKNLADLKSLLAAGGRDLFAELAEPLDTWKRDARLLGSRLIIIALLPKTRERGGTAESAEAWAFVALPTIRELAVGAGLYQPDEKGCLGRLLRRDEAKTGSDIPVELLCPIIGLSRAVAAALNGFSRADDRRIAAIGMGALGSQIVLNLVRAGYGLWTCIDDDYLLPHNLARHELTGAFVGQNKAEALASWASTLFDGARAVKPIAANILEPGTSATEVAESLAGDLVADFSASLAVGRYLARDAESRARRISVFLNASGSDLVVLSEDARRTCKLDALEMQYYRAVLENPELDGHITANEGRVRYAQSCRDVASRVPQDVMSLHAAIGARALRSAAADEGPTLKIWKSGPDLAVQPMTITPAQAIEHRLGDWTLITDAALIQELQDARGTKLPNETGGVLLGSFDVSRRLLYVTTTTGSPPDSVEYPVHYIRGCEGLREEVRHAESRTGGMIQYVGEWHSHPDGVSCCPSGDDRTVFEWIRSYIQPGGLPPLMCIVGEGREAWYLGEMVK